jgi:predicted AlkP superfamily phosphohydrolase/phosphomutase
VFDWSRTKAFPYLEPPYVWVNLKGRDPQGIGEEIEYENVRTDIIQALNHLEDPQTGEKVIEWAVKKEEGKELGQDGEKIGDVIYFLKPSYQLFDYRLEKLDPSIQPKDLLEKPAAYNTQVNCAAHAYYLPDAHLGDYSVSVPLVFYGPGIKNGVEMKVTVDLIDIVPTLAHLLDIPKPSTSQGEVLHQILK